MVILPFAGAGNRSGKDTRNPNSASRGTRWIEQPLRWLGCRASESPVVSKIRVLAFRILLHLCGYAQFMPLKLNDLIDLQRDDKSRGPHLRANMRQKDGFALLAPPGGAAATGTNFQIWAAVWRASPRFADRCCHVGKYNCIDGKIFCQPVKTSCRIGNAYCHYGK